MYDVSAGRSVPTKRSVRVPDADITRILDDLDGAMRQTPRWKNVFSYRQPALRVSFEGVSDEQLAVPTRWISRTGLSFLFGRFVHQRTNCRAKLITVHGTWNDVKATVQICRYVEPYVYEVELDFLQPVDPALYCAKAGCTRVLLVDDQPILSRLVVHLLKELNATVVYCEKPTAAADMALEGQYDLVLLDIDMPEMRGEDVLQKLRERGFYGRVAAFTGTCSDEDRQRLMHLGFDDFLAKPFDRQGLERVIEACRTEPIVSSLAEDPAMSRVISEFVTQYRTWVHELQTAVTAGDKDKVLLLAMELHSQGGTFGFEAISARAAEIERVVRSSGNVESAREAVNGLVEICRLIRAPRKKQG